MLLHLSICYTYHISDLDEFEAKLDGDNIGIISHWTHIAIVIRHEMMVEFAGSIASD